MAANADAVRVMGTGPTYVRADQLIPVTLDTLREMTRDE